MEPTVSPVRRLEQLGAVCPAPVQSQFLDSVDLAGPWLA